MTLVGIFPGTFLMHCMHIWLMVMILFFNPGLCNKMIIMYYLVYKQVFVQGFHFLVLFIRTKRQNSEKVTMASLLASWKIFLTNLLTAVEFSI